MWCITLDMLPVPLDLLTSVLAKSERERLQRYRSKEAATEFLASRGILRVLLGKYLGIDPRSVRLNFGPAGKPRLDEVAHHESVRFNISHAAGVCLLAFASRREVGVDLEVLKPAMDLTDLIPAVLSPTEEAEFWLLPEHLHSYAFLCAWTRKEAVLKALGEGLSVCPNAVEVSMDAQYPKLLRLPKHSTVEWRLLHLEPVEGYVGAVASEGSNYDLSCWRWSNPDTSTDRYGM